MKEVFPCPQRAVIPIAERVFGPEHRVVVDAWNDLGVALSSIDRTAEAREALVILGGIEADDP